MPASKTFVNYKAELTSFEVANERFLGIINPGRVRGFDIISQISPGLEFSLEHSETGIVKTRIDGVSVSAATGVLLTKQGTIAQFEVSADGLAVNANASGSERIDVIYYQHSYQQSIAPNLGIIGIEEGTPGAGEPALSVPAQMIKVGIMRIPDGTAQLTTDMYEPDEQVGVGGKFTQTKDQIIGFDTNLDTKRKEELYAFYRGAQAQLPNMGFYAGNNPPVEEERALMLSIPTIDATVPTDVQVGEFFYFSNGKVCKFNGGSYNLDRGAVGGKYLMVYPSNSVEAGNPDLPWDVINESSTHIGSIIRAGIPGSGSMSNSGPPGVQGIYLVAEDILEPGIDSGWVNNNVSHTILGVGNIIGSYHLIGDTIEYRLAALEAPVASVVQLTLLDGALGGWIYAYRAKNRSVMLAGRVIITIVGIPPTDLAILPVGYRPIVSMIVPGRIRISEDNGINYFDLSSRYPSANEGRIGDIFINANDGTIDLTTLWNGRANIGNPGTSLKLLIEFDGLCYHTPDS